ncbi:hypothetical protein BJ508DRAFT_417749 [Ascobolus immersus RN42]|uniref:TFIIS N-terminal domain-containing protein n=1 Tax=Ascobolus immersus RN42 TaxID=1160509 RepID=A0A3N4HQN3_ASCIM|nr:hypothetical protein BJ508DRAFT_417749 [Ascobolus immersus RN42]
MSDTEMATNQGDPHHDVDPEEQVPAATQDDSDSELSEVDEDLLAAAVTNDLDNAVEASRNILDSSDLSRVKAHRRTSPRGDSAPRQGVAKLQKRRKRPRSEDDDDLDMEGVGIVPDGKLGRRKKSGGGGGGERVKAVREVTPDHLLTPDEQRKREFDRRVAEAIGKKTKKKKKKDGMDIDSQQDEIITQLRSKMIQAADDDWTANLTGKPTYSKVRLLPEVKPVLHNPSLYNSCLDNSLLDAVRKWLEPLPKPEPKGSLPGYDIQKEMFRWLEQIHPTTDLLRESGIGKVVLYYTKDVRPQMGIKRQAENLMREWARPILGRSADYRTKQYEKANVDLDEVYTRSTPTSHRTDAPVDPLAPPNRNPNRTRIPVSMPKTYEIVPVNNVSGSKDVQMNNRGDDIIRRIKARQQNERKGRKSTLKLS